MINAYIIRYTRAINSGRYSDIASIITAFEMEGISMHEKENKLASIRSWWLAVPGGFFALELLLLSTTHVGFIGSSISTILSLCSCSMAFAISFSRGQADFSVFGVYSICANMLGLLNKADLPFGVAAVATICIGAVIGFFNGLVTIPFLKKKWFFDAGVTAILGLGYRFLAKLIRSGYWVGFYSSDPFLLFVLSILLMLGLAALLSFTSGGVRTFNGIYHKEDCRHKDAMTSFVLSGAVTAFATVLYSMWNACVVVRNGYLIARCILIFALAGVGLPNVKKSKGGAFMGYLSVMLAALGVAVLDRAFYIWRCYSLRFNTYTEYIIYAVLAVVFIILNVVLGSKAAKIEYTPKEKAVGGAYGTASGYRSYTNAYDPYVYTGKSKVTAMLLSIFLGPLGVPRYYLGYKGQGLAQTFGCVSLIAGYMITFAESTKRYPSVGLLIFAVILLIYALITTIWAFVDFIRICTRSLEPVVDEYYYQSLPRKRYLWDDTASDDTVPANPTPKVSLEKIEAENPKTSTESKADTAEQVKALSDLARLYENGMIAEEDFNRLKEKILSEK